MRTELIKDAELVKSYIEGNENGLLVFQNYRFASSTEVEELLQFTKGLVDTITNKGV